MIIHPLFFCCVVARLRVIAPKTQAVLYNTAMPVNKTEERQSWLEETFWPRVHNARKMSRACVANELICSENVGRVGCGDLGINR